MEWAVWGDQEVIESGHWSVWGWVSVGRVVTGVGSRSSEEYRVGQGSQ